MSPEHQASDILARLAADGVEATRLCADSRQVLAGDIFVAYPGQRSDGRRYIVDAVHAGASAVLWEREGFQWNEAVDVPNVPVFGLAELSGYIADEFYGRPSQALWTVGVTGSGWRVKSTPAKILPLSAQSGEAMATRCGASSSGVFSVSGSSPGIAAARIFVRRAPGDSRLTRTRVLRISSA